VVEKKATARTRRKILLSSVIRSISEGNISFKNAAYYCTPEKKSATTMTT